MSAEKFSYYSLSYLVLLIILMILGTAGCSLLPKNVEFFQSKIKKTPDKTEKTKELERQSIELIKSDLEMARNLALQERITNTIVDPIIDASIVSDALALSLGPPREVWRDTGLELAEKLKFEIYKLNKKLDEFKKENDKNVSKAIEGTGRINVSYFTYIGIIIGLIFLLSIGLKIYGMINPLVGVGANVLKIPSKVLAEGFSSVVEAGESFKKAIDKQIEDPATKERILELFRLSHERKQDKKVQNIVKTLTK